MAKNYYGGRGGNMGGMNMQQAIKQAQKMQEDMKKMQEEMEKAEYEASSGGGMVTAKVSGNHELLSLTIQPEAIDPDDAEMLQDMVVAAVNAAFAKATEASQKQMQQIAGGLNIPGGLF